MNLGRFIRNGRLVYRLHGLKEAARTAAWEARARTVGTPSYGRPEDLRDQYGLVQDALAEDGAWVIWLDGGRHDWFEELYPEYFEGELERVWNGGVGYTGDWSVRNLDGDYPGRGIFSAVLPGDCGAVDYDDLAHFDVAEDVRLPGSPDVRDRLATLGYLEVEGDEVTRINPEATNRKVLEHADELDGGVVRYLKPHPPFNGLEWCTRGAGKVHNTRVALRDGDITWGDLEDAYADTYREALGAAADLAESLDGRVVVTADHGECLRCGQLFHSRTHKPHGHLVNVPWFEVDTVL